jgi:ATP-binding cassette subfamily B protein
VLDRGKIIERGNHDTLMQQSGKYYQMYQLQQGRPVTSSISAKTDSQVNGVETLKPVVG